MAGTEGPRADRFLFLLVAHSCRVGGAADDHRQNHQWGGDPDPDERRKGHHSGADEWVQGLLQPLRPGTSSPDLLGRQHWGCENALEILFMLLVQVLLPCKRYRETGWWTPRETASKNTVLGSDVAPGDLSWRFAGGFLQVAGGWWLCSRWQSQKEKSVPDAVWSLDLDLF